MTWRASLTWPWETILLSFCEDCGQSGGPHFAPPLLMSALGKSSNPKVKPQEE